MCECADDPQVNVYLSLLIHFLLTLFLDVIASDSAATSSRSICMRRGCRAIARNDI